MLLEVFADIACPWCYIGKRRLETALASMPELEFQVRYRAFELQPGMPSEGVASDEFFTRKFGGEQRKAMIFQRVTEVGRGAGIKFDFPAMPVAPNTRLGHRIVALAAREGKQAQALEALFSGYFEQGKNICDLETALTLVGSEAVGLDANALRDALLRGDGMAEVERDESEAAAIGVTGVPFYLVGDVGMSGAQSVELFRQFLREVAAKAQAGV